MVSRQRMHYRSRVPNVKRNIRPTVHDSTNYIRIVCQNHLFQLGQILIPLISYLSSICSIVAYYEYCSSGIDYIDLDSAFGATSLFMKFSKSGGNHLSGRCCFHCSAKVPYLKQFLIHCNHPVHSSSLSTFL